MQFGLNNSSVTFQRTLNIILFPVNYQLFLVYSDALVIFANTLRKYFTHLQQILELLLDPSGAPNLKLVSYSLDVMKPF